MIILVTTLKYIHLNIFIYFLQFKPDNTCPSRDDLAEMTYHSLSMLSTLSKRASVMMECVFLMGSSSSPVYRASYGYILQVFKTFVKQAGRSVFIIYTTYMMYMYSGADLGYNLGGALNLFIEGVAN